MDNTSMNKTDYVRVKIVARDLEKVPPIVEGAIVPSLYDFFYEWEVEVVHNLDDDASLVKVDRDDTDHGAKRPKTDDMNPMQCQKQDQLTMGVNEKSDAQQQGKGDVGKAIIYNMEYSAPPMMVETRMSVDTSKMVGECSKSQCKLSSGTSKETSVLNSADDRVQGLSSNNITYFEEDDDMLSKGAQGSRSNDQMGKEQQLAGVAICSRFKK
jgi:hypothetical protein